MGKSKKTNLQNQHSPKYPAPTIIILVLLVINAFLLFFLFKSYRDKNTGNNKILQNSQDSTTSKYSASQNGKNYNLLSPTVNVIADDNLLINFVPLKQDLLSITEKYPSANTSIYFEFLNTGANFSINGTDRRAPASLVKVPIAMMIFKKVENRELSFYDQVEILDSDKSSSWGTLYQLPTGSKVSVTELLNALLLESDSTAKNALYRLIDDDGLVTVKEYARVLRALYTASYLTASNSEQLLIKMSQSERNTYIAEKLPSDIVVAHKFGADKNNDYYNDAAIIYLPDRPYILIVLVDAVDIDAFDENLAQQIISDISVKTYDYVREK